VAIVSFWICFGLAMGGVERGQYHIGVFRAMSVIRTARLLTVTSGTTVSAHVFLSLSCTGIDWCLWVVGCRQLCIR
jgi:hypothetical protein